MRWPTLAALDADAPGRFQDALDPMEPHYGARLSAKSVAQCLSFAGKRRQKGVKTVIEQKTSGARVSYDPWFNGWACRESANISAKTRPSRGALPTTSRTWSPIGQSLEDN